MSSDKSFKCTRRAFTEMLISQNEIPNEMSKLSKLAPKIYMPIVDWFTYNKSIVNTDKNKHITPKSCM